MRSIPTVLGDITTRKYPDPDGIHPKILNELRKQN